MMLACFLFSSSLCGHDLFTHCFNDRPELSLAGTEGLKVTIWSKKCLFFFLQTHTFCLLQMLTDGLERFGLLVDYCDVFISCLDSHSDGTHSLQIIHWWASDGMLHFSKSNNNNNKKVYILDGLRVSFKVGGLFSMSTSDASLSTQPLMIMRRTRLWFHSVTSHIWMFFLLCIKQEISSQYDENEFYNFRKKTRGLIV